MITRYLTNDATRLFLFSFLVLFVELALIRWLGSNIVFLSYFSNFILLGSFLGIGVGFLLANSSAHLYRYSPILLALLILFVSIFPVHIVYTGSGMNKLAILGSKSYTATGFPIWITLPLIFVFVTAVMATIAHGVAVIFSRFKPLTAYRLDILGALAGIAVFSLLAYLRTPPIAWGSIVCSIFTILFCKEWPSKSVVSILQIIALFILINALTIESLHPNTFWSPYYKIRLEPINEIKEAKTTNIIVNNIPHQYMSTLAFRQQNDPLYFILYNHIQQKNLDNVLIIGAGSGTDTALALFAGAKHIDAVEIDPVINKIGYYLNPEHPFSNSKVDVTINDGRAFLQQSHQSYDLIIFALPDSLTLVSGQSSLRLESYLFTLEAIQNAKQHLNPGGVLVMYNCYWQTWLIDRLATTLKTVFGHAPCLDTAKSEAAPAVLTISDNAADISCSTTWQSISGQDVSPVTDDHPFLYLQNNSIPKLYQVTLLLILLLTLIITSCTGGAPKAIKSHADLFFMGMAFLLLETKSIVAFSLLYGNTWMVNAMVFAGILIMVYLAIETVQRFAKLPFIYLYGLLLGALALEWVTPISILLSLPIALRFTAATLLIFSPVYLANLIFASQFQHEGNESATAFGVNMLGAMIGGMLEYVALITGYQFLISLVAVFYTLAFLFGKRKEKLALEHLS